MSKRFIDTGIWEKPWFMELPPDEKMAVMYLMTKCDNVGVWVPNFRLASFQIGNDVDWTALVGKCHGNIEILPDEKWFLVDFCRFQYGELSEDCKPHQSYLSLLQKHGLSDRVVKGYAKGCQTLKDKDKEKDKDKDKDKSGDFDMFYEVYPRRINRAGALRAWKARVKDGTMVVAEVMAAVALYTKAVAGKDVDYVMHPATFLGPAMRWKDYLTTGSKYVPASKASDDLAWVCGGCGEKYRSTAATCSKCGEERKL